MAVKTTQWLALAMLLSVAVAAMAARQEDVDASIAAKKNKDNYHKDDYHKDDYHKDDYHKGGEYYPKGGEYYGGGEYYPKGGDYYPKGGDYYGSDYYAPKGDYYPGGEYPGDNYPTEEYPSYDQYPGYGGYGKGPLGHLVRVPAPSQAGATTCPTSTGGSAACTVVCPLTGTSTPFGCYVQSNSGTIAAVSCPGHTRVIHCDFDCQGNEARRVTDADFPTFRKTCVVECDGSPARVRALCG